MKDETNFKEERFDSYLNKTIILSSKKYYQNKIEKDLKELKIIDDEKYATYINNYLDYEADIYNSNRVDNCIE